MSDLGGGRPSNGGPVPVPTSGTPTGLKTPRDVMRDRRAREARRQEEAKLEEQRQIQQAEERRRSADRRAAAAASAAEQRYSASSQYTPDVSASQGAFPGARLSSGGAPVASGSDYGVPTGRAVAAADSGYASGGASRRVTGTSQSQDQPRPATQTAPASSSRRAQAPRQSSGSASQYQSQPQAQAQAQPQQQQQQQQQSSSQTAQQGQSGADPSQGGRASSFPHAFERWEQMSSHWEGLTSYWLRKLETDAEEIQRSVPSASAMSRQITDLSAAGANLFHAVVELQRLRASSERKFQRWFFETRADTERNAETRAQLEEQVHAERAERQRAARQRVESEIAAENGRREVAEMRRELMISKEEARRAWEELGRRNQESLELADSLKAGRMTIVSGVQVMPIFGGPSRTGSASQHPPGTRDGPSAQYERSNPGGAGAGAAGLRSPGDDDDEEEYYREEEEEEEEMGEEVEGDSPTNTDPFTEGKQPPLHHEPGVQSLASGTYQPYPPATTSGGSSAQPAYASPSQRGGPSSSASRTAQQPMTTTAAEAQRFYQSAPHDPSFPSSAQTSSQAARSQPQAPAPAAPTFQHHHHDDDPGADIRSESDDWDTEADVRRERELLARYGGDAPVPPEAPSAPPVSSAAGPTVHVSSYAPTTTAGHETPPHEDNPDYEGAGYTGWENLGARHHHPTRLSDVLEEEEERSSRRTAE